MLDQFGNVIGVITSRVDTSESGRPVTGIGFAIPINDALASSTIPVAPATAIPSLPTPFPPIVPIPDVDAAKAALDQQYQAMEAQRQLQVQATRAAIEAQQEIDRYAAALEAERIANLPTPTPQPTATPLPPPTPQPTMYCREWETMVHDWINEGNRFWDYQFTYNWDVIPVHPRLTLEEALAYCVLDFPYGQMRSRIYGTVYQVGTDRHNILPGTYKYHAPNGDDRVGTHARNTMKADCTLTVNYQEHNKVVMRMPYGQPFQYQLLTYHNLVKFKCSWANSHDRSALMVRIGD